MISLNTMRTRFGIVLSVVIVLALLAFIISLGPEMGFGSKDPVVGVINGDKVTYTEYLDEYETVKAGNGGSEATDEQADALARTTWQSLVAKNFIVPDFNKAGLEVTQAERLSMLSGEHPSQVFYSMFADQQTGDYDVAQISAFLSQINSNPQYQSFWSYLNSQAVLERLSSKFAGIVKAGTFVNSLEVEQGLAAANESRNGRYVTLPYTTIADSLVTVTDAEIQKFYDEHKSLYKKLPNRSLTYVVFDVEPTEEDMKAIEEKVMAIGEEFAAVEDVRAYVRKNMGTITENYVPASLLSEDEAVMAEGKQYGPVLNINEWEISRPIDIKDAPDSIGLSHIVLSAQNASMADSLVTALKGGADFAAAAAAHSAATATAQVGGELGVLPFSAIPVELAGELAAAKKGDIIKTEAGEVIQIFKVTRVDAKSKHILIGSLSFPVEPSSATRRAVHSSASLFAVDAKGSVDKFNASANTAAITPRVARLQQGERSLSVLEKSHEIARWAHGAKVGEISEIFNMGNAYVIAMVTAIDDTKYLPVSEVSLSITQTLRRDKKFAMLQEKLAGSSLEAIAQSAGVEVKPFENVKFSDYGVADMSLEPRVAGAIASTVETGKLSAPIQGYSGAVVFVVDNVNKAETQTAEAEKVLQQANLEAVATQASVMALQRMVEIEDLRGQYF
ncbi:MAG: SurA N-terminal domain-containing protein [Alistipes sp.]|nr:SurA N-terminal domain-containing protein [Alistipes sp.]